MNNLHLIQDGPHSNWFVERCIKFNADTTNTFVCISNAPKYISNPSVNVKRHTAETIENIISEINKGMFQQLIISYLDDIAAGIVEKISNNKIKITWIIWGADLYYLPKFWKNNYDGYSSSFLNNTFKSNLIKRYRAAKGHYIHGHYTHHNIYKAIKRIDTCATLTQGDYELVRTRLNKKIKLIDFVISGIDDFINMQNRIHYQEKQNVLQIGNSADPSNNHYEIFEKLKQIKFSGKLYCPLAYSNLKYAQKLKSDIEGWFPKEQLQFAEAFIPKEEYFEKISKIGFVVMGHTRQQSFGNLVAQLYFGAKVFLREEAPLHRLFSGWGLKVYTIGRDLNNEELSGFLDKQSQEKNRQILADRLSNERLKQMYINLLNGTVNA